MSRAYSLTSFENVIREDYAMGDRGWKRILTRDTNGASFPTKILGGTRAIVSLFDYRHLYKQCQNGPNGLLWDAAVPHVCPYSHNLRGCRRR